MAKLRQNAPNRWTHEELSPLPAQPHKAIPTTPRVRCGKKGKRRAPRAPRSHVAPPSESHRRHMTIVLPPATWACDSKLFLWRQAHGAAQPVPCRGATAAPGRGDARSGISLSSRFGAVYFAPAIRCSARRPARRRGKASLRSVAGRQISFLALTRHHSIML
jgi:hypothetical protein